jgi:hypothetical protein
MNMEKKNYEAPEQKSEKESGSDSTADQTIFKRGAEAYGQAEQAVSDAYDKTSEKVSETYEKARSYSSDNPGKSILIALGKELGWGFSWVQARVARIGCHRPACPTRGQRTLRNRSGLLALTRSVTGKRIQEIGKNARPESNGGSLCVTMKKARWGVFYFGHWESLSRSYWWCSSCVGAPEAVL